MNKIEYTVFGEYHGSMYYCLASVVVASLPGPLLVIACLDPMRDCTSHGRKIPLAIDSYAIEHISQDCPFILIVPGKYRLHSLILTCNTSTVAMKPHQPPRLKLMHRILLWRDFLPTYDWDLTIPRHRPADGLWLVNRNVLKDAASNHVKLTSK